MQKLIRAMVAGAILVMLAAATTLAKGESISATIGPIDDISAGTPTPVSVLVQMNGTPATGTLPVYLDFYDPKDRSAIEFPVVYDLSARAYVAQVTLPREGNWVVSALLRADIAGQLEPLGRVDGTRMAIVKPAPTPSTPATPIVPLTAGALAASGAWSLGVAGYVIRRRRSAKLTAPAVGDRMPA